MLYIFNIILKLFIILKNNIIPHGKAFSIRNDKSLNIVYLNDVNCELVESHNHIKQI